MKLPTLQEARNAIGALATITGHGETVKAADQLVGIVIDLFDDQPADQATLKGDYEEAKARTDAALDRLDTAIAERQRGG